MTHLGVLEEGGLDCGMDDVACQARRIASDHYRRLKNTAVVHGDVHLRNVLLRSDTDVQFIDFAATSAGHPALDLVRFELALYLGPVRQFEDERSSLAFQRALSIDRASLAILEADFPWFFTCQVNKACAVGMTAARDQAIEVLRAHGGDARDYLAAKFLIAWQNIGMIGRNSALARATVLALVEVVKDWE